ncbi:MAG: MMPL family transporter, partial [Nocardioides sp.]|nr:MMPL family transporter [Nocardioides sp.]
ARVGRGGLSSRLLGPVVRRPGVALALSTVVVLALAAPALGLRTSAGNLETLPADIPEVATMSDLSAAFPAEGAAATLVVRADASQQDDVADALAAVEDRAVASGDFAESGEDVVNSEDGRTTVLRIGMPYDEADERVNDALRELRGDLVPAAFDGLDVETVVGGGAAENLDYSDRQSDRLPLVIGFVLLLTFLMMLATFRSLPIALLSTGLNLASVGVAFGVLVLVFQHGWGSGLLDFQNPGFVIDWLPLFVLVVLLGLSMDYHVFVVSRIREHVDSGLPTRLAVQRGIADTAGVVTSAAGVMVSVFAIFATLSMLEMKMMGVGLSAAILLDATLVRLVMLPAALVLLGDRAWWPGRPVTPRGEQVQDPAYELATAP